MTIEDKILGVKRCISDCSLEEKQAMVDLYATQIGLNLLRQQTIKELTEAAPNGHIFYANMSAPIAVIDNEIKDIDIALMTIVLGN